MSASAIVPDGLSAPCSQALDGGPLLAAVRLAANPAGNVLSGLWAAR